MADLFATDCVTVEAESKESFVLLFFHGLGDTGHGWSQILTEVRPSHVKIICPTAPVMPVTINRGARMPSWFDVFDLSKGGKQDKEGIKATTKKVHLAIEELEKNGTPSNKILLGGISQGGALAIYSALTYPHPLAGLLCLSTWLPVYDEHDQLLHDCLECNKEIPMLQCHGDCDHLVKYSFGQFTAQVLSSINPKHHLFKTYEGLGHWINPKEMADVQEWLLKVLTV